MNRKKYLEIFSREAEEQLQVLRQGSLDLEQEGVRAEGVRAMLRSAHTLKGSARLLDLKTLGEVTHGLEGLLRELEQGVRDLAPGLIDLLLMAADAIEGLIAQAHSGEAVDVRVDLVLEGLRTGTPPEVPVQPRRQNGRTDSVPMPNTVKASVARLDQLTNLLGELLISRRVLGARSRQLGLLIRRLEEFLPRSRKAENYRQFKDLLSDLGKFSLAFEEDGQALAGLAERLHEEAMELRMLPLATITDELARMVRTLTRDQGKEAQLAVVGADVELDRAILDALRPMLLHMLRNAVDHGLEMPEERQRCGKPACGRIEITATTEGGFVHLRLADDGRGIDPARIREVAVNNGFLRPEEAAGLSDEEAIYLILRPGFSTSEALTDLSGRGVGMDVVKSQIDLVKGNLVIHSTPGRGTEMILQVPLTMAVVNGLVFDCEGETYAVPLHYVTEIVRLAEKDIFDEGGQETIRVRDRSLPLLSLRELLQIPRDPESADERPMALVLRFREQQLACLVTRTREVQDLVIKTLGSQLKSVRYSAGATILEDGCPALILSVPDLFGAALTGQNTRVRQELAKQRAARRRGRILVVDDSMTTRIMEKNILEAHGYEVAVAVSGPEALAQLGKEVFDLVVSDVQMPEMDGFELTALLRQQERTRELPVVIVTSMGTDEDRRKGLAVGAQAYIVKGAFDQGLLLETVEHLIG